MYVAGDGHFNLEPQSHVTPKTAPILDVKVLLGLVVQGAVSAWSGGGSGGGRPLGEEMGLNKVVAQDRL